MKISLGGNFDNSLGFPICSKAKKMVVQFITSVISLDLPEQSTTYGTRHQALSY